MTETPAPDNILLTQWARLLLDSFADAQVREVVLSPGSRSTPFAAAALANPALRCTTLIDERSAAFFALGLSKAFQKPALLICTSGTAGANYLPAILEAALSYTPLLVLTADRPLELDQCHAPQTLDQVKLYGGHVRAFFDLGEPDSSARALRALRRKAAQAVLASLAPTPGAVHLNGRARKPLEPVRATEPSGRRLEKQVDALLARPQVQIAPPVFGQSPDSLLEISGLLRREERGLIVCGPAPAAHGALGPKLAELSRRTGYPLLVEAASQLRYSAPEEGPPVLRVGSLDALARSPIVRERLAPQVILQIGAPPVAAGWEAFLGAQPECQRVVIAPHGWNDPWSSASWIVQADPHEVVDDLLLALKELPDRAASPWREAWGQAEMIARKAADEVLALAPDDLTEGAVARMVVEALPEEGLLALGNSLPIREVDAYSPPQAKGLRVWSQRGVAGIDGVVAGAAGFAKAWGLPGALLIGDVSFLHSISDLASLRHLRSPWVIVVVNNDGGRIFEQLPISQLPTTQLRDFEEQHLDAWITPHGLDLAAAAQLHNLPYRRVTTRARLRQVLEEALAAPRVTLIEAKVPPHGAREQNQHLWRRVEELLAAELPHLPEAKQQGAQIPNGELP